MEKWKEICEARRLHAINNVVNIIQMHNSKRVSDIVLSNFYLEEAIFESSPFRKLNHCRYIITKMPLINVIVIALLATLCAILGPDEKGGVDRNRGEAAIVAGG